jgi:Xaa-Pro dipeptidase
MSERRIAALRELMAARQVQAVALVPGANLLYLTGLDTFLSERPIVVLLPLAGTAALIVPAFEVDRIQPALGFEARAYPYTDEEGHPGAFRAACRDLGLGGARLGVEFLSMRVLERQRLEEHAPGIRFVDADPLISELRVCKDAEEIESMRQAARLNREAFHAVEVALRPGRSERQLALEYRIAALRAGAARLSFEPIIGAGPNGALGHSDPGDRPVRSGELVVVDAGVKYDGYCSDITRTYAVGRVSDELRRIYDVVRQANEAGRAAARPGATAGQVDAAARVVIAAAGYGARFTHRTGHGLGIEIHEPPYIVAGSELVLRPGMVFTVEPGIYLPGVGGVRIEDNVVITGTGAETITDLPRELVEL